MFMIFTPMLALCYTICFLLYGLWCLTPLLTIFQLYRGGFSVINKHPVNLNDTDLRWTCADMHHMSINKIVQSLSICGISFFTLPSPTAVSLFNEHK